MVQRFLFKAAVALMLIRDSQTFLLKRAFTGWEDGKYCLIGGHVEGNESIARAMQREAKEEVGIDIALQDLHVVHVMHRYYKKQEYIEFYLTTDSWQGTLQNMEPNKCSEIGWFPLEKLPKNILPLSKQALEKYQQKVFFSEYGFL